MSTPNERLSPLFIVRFWWETGRPSGKWRGLVEQVPNGPRRYFDCFADLDDFIALRLDGSPETEPGAGLPNGDG